MHTCFAHVLRKPAERWPDGAVSSAARAPVIGTRPAGELGDGHDSWSKVFVFVSDVMDEVERHSASEGFMLLFSLLAR